MKSFLGNSEEKNKKLVDNHISEGNEHLKKKMYNGALIEFSKAMELDAKYAYPKLLSVMESVAEAGEYESALAIGLNLIKEKKKEFELTNTLGNYARKLGDYKQAHSLYKLSYKINKDFKVAFYNLAACEAKSDFYDDGVLNAISQFKDIKDFYLPSYKGGEKAVNPFVEKVTQIKQRSIQAKLHELGESA